LDPELPQRTRKPERLIAFCFFLLCAYLLVPLQAIAYRRFTIDGSEPLFVFAGAPLSYLLGRVAWERRLTAATVVSVACWLWLGGAVLLNFDPHGFGPRTTLLLRLICWVPPLNTLLLAVLFAVTSRRPPPLHFLTTQTAD
jgi:hypothetical protein